MEWKKLLNSSQHEAVTAIDGPVLVIAGAGSGKTRVIEYRVLYLVQNKISPNSILLLTFTRKAAREMLSRAAKHDPRCKNVDGGTFHSFAYKILKRYGKLIGLSGTFSVLDEGDAEEAIHRCATKMDLFDKEKRFPRKDTLRSIISMSLNKNISLAEVLKREYPHFLEYAPEIEELRKKYTEYKINKNYLDYDDLLVYLRLLLENPDIKERLSRKYQFIMVDEYQDTNILQGDITYLLAEKHQNVMVVGDDAQSIYGFRGASHENIMKFPQRFPGCRIIKLEENYRSTQSILDLANSVLENMHHKYSKCLIAARKLVGTKPQILFFKGAYDEAEWVADTIKQLRDEGIDLGHQGVLFRSSYISIPLQAELSKRNIPYQVFGGLKFYETAHVKDIVAHFKILVNPKDELAWNRVLMLIAGIGPKTSERIIEEMGLYSCLNDIIDGLFQKYYRTYKNCQQLAKLSPVLKAASRENLSVGEQFEIILDYYHPILKDKFDDWHLRLNDLVALGQICMRYNSLEEVLADFAIEPPERGVWRVEPSTPEEEKPVTLSTIHSAKGLEWDTVFLVGLMDGVLPVGYALDNEDDIEEEHRLFYVGITRAKNQLFLSLHHEGTKGGISQFNKISRFVDVPNVLSKMEQKDSLALELNQKIICKESEEVTPFYDKEILHRKVIEFFNSR
jgi:DNA helicase-2/ATP-dependent DNA helicase PcrA